MATPNLAKIERVDLREAWPNEAVDFTPWLAENIAVLGEALGMDLELQDTEAAVGGYSLDVLATDLNQNRPVIIENQLETTNHDHLGKLITYAAGYDANVVVWLTRDFRDEHRQALDWLNQRTGEETQFFGVVVELWRIGDSLPAPYFKAVATPNDWRKMQVRPVNVTQRDEQNYQWRRNLIENLRQRNVPLVGRRHQAKATWLVIEQPIANVSFTATWRRGGPGLEMTAEKTGIEGREWNQRLFDTLTAHRDKIQAEMADPNQNEWFTWEPTDGPRIRSRVIIYRDGNVFEDTELRNEYSGWITQKLFRFRQVLIPYLKEFATQEQPTIE